LYRLWCAGADSELDGEFEGGIALYPGAKLEGGTSGGKLQECENPIGQSRYHTSELPTTSEFPTDLPTHKGSTSSGTLQGGVSPFPVKLGPRAKSLRRLAVDVPKH